MGFELRVDDDALRVRIDGLDQMLCFTHGVELRWSEVVRAEAVPVSAARAELGWRTMGGYFPGWFATGWYKVKNRPGGQLWRVYRAAEVLLVDTTRDRPCRLVLQVDDPVATAAAIGERVAPAGGPGGMG